MGTRKQKNPNCQQVFFNVWDPELELLGLPGSCSGSVLDPSRWTVHTFNSVQSFFITYNSLENLFLKQSFYAHFYLSLFIWPCFRVSSNQMQSKFRRRTRIQNNIILYSCQIQNNFVELLIGTYRT
jgi:hypothetical protein